MLTKEQHEKITRALVYLKDLDNTIGDLRQASIDLGWRAANPPADWSPENTVLESNEFKVYETTSNDVWDLMYTIQSLLNDLTEEEVSD